MELTKAKKISVVGNSGAGKSTIAEKLGNRLDIDVLSVDKIYWLPNWQLRDKESFKSIHDQWLAADSWIIEGVGYWTEMEQRITESDVVIFVDVPVDVCKAQAVKRVEEESFSRNPYVPEGCVYTGLEERQMEVIEYFHSTMRPRLINLVSGIRQEKVMIVSCYSGLNIGIETTTVPLTPSPSGQQFLMPVRHPALSSGVFHTGIRVVTICVFDVTNSCS